jgi:hypothetical protein
MIPKHLQSVAESDDVKVAPVVAVLGKEKGKGLVCALTPAKRRDREVTSYHTLFV